MQLKPEEISKVIRSQIKYYENAIQQNETGTILMVGDGIARASGLVNCMAGEPVSYTHLAGIAPLLFPGTGIKIMGIFHNKI